MTSMAFSLYDADNLVPLAPFGAGGVLKGAVAAFFGFLGFDEVGDGLWGHLVVATKTVINLRRVKRSSNT